MCHWTYSIGLLNSNIVINIIFVLKVNNVEMDGNWKKLLDLVGVTEDQMQKKETMDFIYDFVEKRGGIENVTREIELERKSGPAAPGKNK